MSINDRGQILGVSETSQGQVHPFLWQDSVMYDLVPALCADTDNCLVTVRAINDRGEVAYTMETGSYSNILAYKVAIEPGALTSLPSVSTPLSFVTPERVGQVDGGSEPAIGEAGLSVQLRANISSARRGDLVQYEIMATNYGPNKALDVMMRDLLPSNAHFVPELSDVQFCASNGATVDCGFSELSAGESLTLFLTLQSYKGRSVKNSVTVQSVTIDPDIGNNDANVTVRLKR